MKAEDEKIEPARREPALRLKKQTVKTLTVRTSIRTGEPGPTVVSGRCITPNCASD